MRKKILAALSCLLLTAICLSSCGGNAGSGTTPKGTTPTATTTPAAQPTTVLLYGNGQQIALIMGKGATAAEQAAYCEVRDRIGMLTGFAPQPTFDDAAPAAHELLIGNTNRPLSAAAKALLSVYENDTETGAFAILVSDSSIALVANCDDAYPNAVKYLNERYLISDALSLAEGFSDVATFSLADYYAELAEQERLKKEAEEEARKKERLEAYNRRWDALTGVLSSEAIASLQKLYTLYGDGALYWMARLWDPSVGGFYYANSARDTEGFLPDIESTYQVLGFLKTTGLVENLADGLEERLPPEMLEKVINFTLSLQDPDGYFYHPQWGKDIRAARRGRDLSWATEILKWFGVKPKYPPATDRLENQEDTLLLPYTVRRMLAGEPSALPEYLLSEAAFLNYLRSFDFANNSHNAGHTISSQKEQIKAAGLLDVFCDYMDSIQNPETGLWEARIDYDSLAGLYKIANTYNLANRPLRHTDRMIDSAIEAILSDSNPQYVIDAYNPFAALNSVIKNMNSTNKAVPGTYDMASVYAKTRARATELVEQAISKISLFQRADGSFSYEQKKSAPYTQGTLVSLGVEEGDVNGTKIAIGSLSSALFGIFGVAEVPLYCDTHLETFLSIIAAAKPPVKTPYNTVCTETVDFEEQTGKSIPPCITTLRAQTDLAVVDDPVNGENHALRLISYPGVGDRILIKSDLPDAPASCLRFSVDILVSEVSGGSYFLQLGLGEPDRYAYMLTLTVGENGVLLKDTATTKNTKNCTEFGTVAKLGEWFNLEARFYPGDADSFRVEIYLNGTLFGTSTNFFNADSAKDAVPLPGFDTISIWAMKNVGVTMLIDNLTPIEHTAK